MTRPLPTVEPLIEPATQPFWAATVDDRLLVPSCVDCAVAFWYPRPRCPSCGSTRIEWIESTGKGAVYSYTVVRRAAGEWAEVVPYTVAMVELDEGPRLLTNIVDTDPERISIGSRVEVRFDPAGPTASLPRFRVADR